MQSPVFRQRAWWPKVNLALAIAVPLASRLHAVIRHTGMESETRRARRVQGPVTPAAPTFAIWGPLFAISIVQAALRATRERRDDPAFRRLGWLTSAAYAFNIAWSINAQLASLGWRSVALIGAGAATSVAAATAASGYERQARRNRGEARMVCTAMAPLAGWLTVATFSNVEAALNTTQGRPSAARESRRAIALVAAASATAAAAAVAMRGNLLYSGAAACGLAGIIAKNRARRPGVARAAGVGLAAVACATLLARRRR